MQNINNTVHSKVPDCKEHKKILFLTVSALHPEYGTTLIQDYEKEGSL
jgi:hypothetical protein